MRLKRKVRKNLRLTEAEFLVLLKAVYIANWVANGTASDDRHREYDILEDAVFSQASAFGLSEFSESDSTSDGRSYPTAEFEKATGIQNVLDDYDDDVFWDTLVRRLSWRDFIETFGMERIEEMDAAEKAEKLSAFEAKYDNEVESFGIDRLFLPVSRKTKLRERN